MMIKKPFLLIVIAAILGMFSACDDLTIPNLTPQYTVNFFANGGSPAPQSQTITQGDKVTEPAAMTKAGYSFGGWYMETAYSNQWNFAVNVVIENISLYAKWDTIYSTVSFNADGGSPAPQQQNIAYGGKVSEPSYMTKTGYGFGGWYKEAAFTNLWDFDNDTVVGNITLYAKWDSNYHTVSFEANGGTPVPQQQDAAHGYKAINPQDMSKEGFIFEGWYKEATCINLWDFEIDTVTENITLYAKWIENFTITFNANGGTPATVQQSIAYGGKAHKPDGIIKQGYAIEGWYTEEALTNQWDFDADAVTANITLYAKWIEAFTVTFNANGGTPAPGQQSIAHGGNVTEPSVMIKSGYTFSGWYKEAAYTNRWNFSTDTVTANITLYAKWLEAFTVTFNADGGSPAPAQQSIAHGDKVTEPSVMIKSGCTFGGWYKEVTFINLWNFNSDTITQNIVLYAKWNLVPPTTVQGTDLAQKLQWVASNAASNTNYILEVNKDELLNPHTLYFSGKSNITIQLTGIGGVKNIEIYNSGSLFTIENNVTLVLNENIVLKGKTNNNAPLVMINGGNLIMNNGSKITGNTIASSGSGVYVNSGTFAMNGGEISGNSSSSNSSGGGGVYVGNGTFTMNGGKISGNTASSSTSYSYGGGVYVGSGTFTMAGGEISGNTASTSYSYGGGVYVGSGIFIMTGGEISGNTASSYGGGVYVGAVSNSRFEKTGGIITGYSSDTINGNVVKSGNNIRNNCGHAVYAEHSDSRFIRYKEFTAGQQNNLIYIRNEPVPLTISGDWNLPVPDAPGVPTIVTLSSGSLTVQWTAVERALAYEVWMGTTNNSAYATKRADVFGVSTTLTGLTNGTTYYVWLKAKNDTGASGFSPMTSDILLGTPGAPTVTPGLKQLQVTWTAVPGAEEYEVYYGTGATPTTLVTTTTGTTATITGLNNGTTYYVRLRAKKANGISDYGPTANNVPGSQGLYRGNEGVGNQNLSAALTYISSNAVSGDIFLIVLGADESASPRILSYSGKTVGITLRGYGGERTITLTSNGSMFTINNGVTFTLDENITLQGRSTNNSSLVRVNDGTFTMNGGEISGNTASSSASASASSYGGGVYVTSGTFTMNGGEISGNTASSSSASYGGGVYVGSNSNFEKTGGIITGYSSDTVNGNILKDINGNIQNDRGHAVYVGNTPDSNFIRRKETTSGQGDNLKYIRNEPAPPTISGAWEE